MEPRPHVALRPCVLAEVIASPAVAVLAMAFSHINLDVPATPPWRDDPCRCGSGERDRSLLRTRRLAVRTAAGPTRRRCAVKFRTGAAMSVTAIAAALAREGLSAGERLVAFSLASFADRENRAWPGAPAATARAGLSRSRYLQARDQLVRRGLIVVEDAATGRGRASTLGLRFADQGPWSEREINAPLFEAALAYSHARGPARLLLATIGALANEDRVVEDLTTELLCSAAGLADRTYRRARQALLASGELVLLNGAGGRGNTNRWEIPDPRLLAGEASPLVGRRPPPPAGARPLVAPVAVPVSPTNQESPGSSDLAPVHAAGKGGQDQTLSLENCPILTGVSGVKGGQDQTLFAEAEAETPAERAAKTRQKPRQKPRHSTRARERNPRTKEPSNTPQPPQGGRSDNSITIEETYTTGSGRKRHRRVDVNLDEVRRMLGVPGASDHADWARIRKLLAEAVGESTFTIWFEPVELIAIDPDGSLVLHPPPELHGWLQDRFSRVVAQAAECAGRATRIADATQSAAMGAS